MNFLGMGPGELMVIMVLALIVFGPQKLPEIGQGLGKAIGEFRRATSQITDEINRELTLDAQPKQQTTSAPASPPTASSAPAAETPVTGQAQAEPLVLEIKPPTESAAVESAPLNETPSLVPEEVAPESPAAYAPAEEVAVETHPAAPNVSERAARARRARKTTETSQPVETTSQEPAGTIEG